MNRIEPSSSTAIGSGGLAVGDAGHRPELQHERRASRAQGDDEPGADLVREQVVEEPDDQGADGGHHHEVRAERGEHGAAVAQLVRGRTRNGVRRPIESIDAIAKAGTLMAISRPSRDSIV